MRMESNPGPHGDPADDAYALGQDFPWGASNQQPISACNVAGNLVLGP